jgi:transcriptional regulator with XRE-family HTH domain
MAYQKNLNLIGPQLQKLRNTRQWSQSQLSKRLRSMGWHITRDILAQMETTAHRITDCDLIFLAKALEVNVIYFFPPVFTPETIHAKIHSRRLKPVQDSRFARVRCFNAD